LTNIFRVASVTITKKIAKNNFILFYGE